MHALQVAEAAVAALDGGDQIGVEVEADIADDLRVIAVDVHARVAPGHFVDRDAVGPLGFRRLGSDFTAELPHHFLKCFHEGSRDHRQHHAIGAVPAKGPQGPHHLPDLTAEDGDQLLDDAVGRGQGMGKTHGGHERREHHHRLAPGPGRRQRHLQFRDDAVAAVGMVDQVDAVPGQLNQTGLRFDTDHLEAQDVAAVAQDAVDAAANARMTAAHEAAERGDLAGGRMHAQLPAGRPRDLVDGREACSGFGAHPLVTAP